MEYIAHIRESDGREQTVAEHCHGVADASFEIGKKLAAENFAYLQAIIHDFGKLSKTFDDYIHGRSSYSRGEIDHSFAGGRYICEIAKETNDNRCIAVANFSARTVVSHHGLHDWVDEDGNDYLKKRISKNDKYDEIKSNASQILSDNQAVDLLNKAVPEYEKIKKRILAISDGDIKKLCFYMGLFERIMQSILIDADRTDTADFMSDSISELPCKTPMLWETMHSNIESKCGYFMQKTDFVSQKRMSISNRCAAFARHRVGVCRLVVPTGGGKTLSSLRFAIEYCREFKMDRIIYVAPFMSILEQNSDAIREISGDEAILEHYSDFEQSIEQKEELDEYELRSVKWDSPVIATTLVQFLNTLFSGRSASVRRMHRLCNSVIIIDEVQSIPVKCVHMFNLAVNFLSKICGCTVVLCSATQPAFEETKYPIIMDSQESITGDYAEDFAAFKRVELISYVTAEGYSYDEAAEFCYEKYLGHKSLLVVLNTKNSALQIYKRIKEMNESAAPSDKAVMIHLSTSMCAAHRRNHIETLKHLLAEGKNVICVTTQLIEAGVDLSFKCVIRSLAGLDNAAQAAGRCNRNGEYQCCPVYLIRLSEENIQKLHEIKTAQDVSTQILTCAGDNDALSVETLTAYFKKYYDEKKNELSYNITDPRTGETLIDLLSDNGMRCGIKRLRLWPHAQAFASAGKEFKVIDNNTFDIIVPYNDEAKKIILALNGNATANELSELLRKAQCYSIGIYQNTKEALERKNAIYELNNGYCLILKDGFYSSNIGLDLNGEESFEFCI